MTFPLGGKGLTGRLFFAFAECQVIGKPRNASAHLKDGLAGIASKLTGHDLDTVNIAG